MYTGDPYAPPPMWLTSVGDHQRRRICRMYHPEGCPDDLWRMKQFADKYGLNMSPYTQMAGKVQGLWYSGGGMWRADDGHRFFVIQEDKQYLMGYILLAFGALALFMVLKSGG